MLPPWACQHTIPYDTASKMSQFDPSRTESVLVFCLDAHQDKINLVIGMLTHSPLDCLKA
jgi:hypothetical protein